MCLSRAILCIIFHCLCPSFLYPRPLRQHACLCAVSHSPFLEALSMPSFSCTILPVEQKVNILFMLYIFWLYRFLTNCVCVSVLHGLISKKGMLWIGELVKPVTIEKCYPHLEFDGGSCIENSRGVLCGQRLDRNVDVWDSVWCGKSILKRVQLEFTIFKTIIISWISLIDKIK